MEMSSGLVAAIIAALVFAVVFNLLFIAYLRSRSKRKGFLQKQINKVQALLTERSKRNNDEGLRLIIYELSDNSEKLEAIVNDSEMFDELITVFSVVITLILYSPLIIYLISHSPK